MPILTGLLLLCTTAHFDDAPAGRPLERYYSPKTPSPWRTPFASRATPRAVRSSSISRS